MIVANYFKLFFQFSCLTFSLLQHSNYFFYVLNIMSIPSNVVIFLLIAHVSLIFLRWSNRYMRISRQHAVTWWMFLTISWPVLNVCATLGLKVPAFCTTTCISSASFYQVPYCAISMWSGLNMTTKLSCRHWLVKFHWSFWLIAYRAGSVMITCAWHGLRNSMGFAIPSWRAFPWWGGFRWLSSHG